MYDHLTLCFRSLVIGKFIHVSKKEKILMSESSRNFVTISESINQSVILALNCLEIIFVFKCFPYYVCLAGKQF